MHGIARNWKEFPPIPESQILWVSFRTTGPGYWSNSATEFPELQGIPTNSGIITYMGLFAKDRSWLSIEFRYGIPGIVRTRNRSGIGRNSRNRKEFLPIPTNFGITTYIGLILNDRCWRSIEFRYGIPGIVRTRNRLEMV
jgi:hypothetical protein